MWRQACFSQTSQEIIFERSQSTDKLSGHGMTTQWKVLVSSFCRFPWSLCVRMQICSQPQWNVEWLFTKLTWMSLLWKILICIKGQISCLLYYWQHSMTPNNGAMDWITSDFSLKWMGTVNRGWDYYSDTFPRSLALHLTSLALPHCSPCRSSSAAVRP